MPGKPTKHALVTGYPSRVLQADSLGEGSKIVATLIADLMKTQSSVGTHCFVETWSSLADLYAPGGLQYMLSRLPEVYQKLSNHWLKSAMDQYTIVARSQQQMLDWEMQSVARGMHLGLPWHNGELTLKRPAASVQLT